MAILTEPAVQYRETYLQALQEFQAEGHDLYLDYQSVARHFPTFVQDLWNRSRFPRPGHVAETQFWLIEAREFIGRLSLRHTLNDSLLQFGGHIGYEIRPSKRRLGYGKLILKLGLEKAKAIGLQRVLVTCDDDNIGSAKIIEANGGALENTILLPSRSVATRRYWIDINPES